tara:strand:- start:200 stop:2575 length:2376 start_codon:yes stop_codon:yes gene_type:complete
MADEKQVEALQYGKPGKNDPRKTPAKPSERRKGSKKNPPGSAKKPNAGIKVSKETEARLRSLMQKHNSSGKGSKASMGMLKTVYRRGAGAFSRSHAPNMSRGGWGIARVKAFLYLLRNGRPSNPNYKQDNDLLPRGHPRKSAKADEEGVEAAEYNGKKVTLNKPFRTPKGPKKFAVYVQNESGRVVIVRFGDPNMEIKRDDPGRRKNFRSRHNCDNPGPKTKARYWSCKMWERSKSVTQYTSNETTEDELWFDVWSQNEGEDMTEEYAEFYDEYDDVVEAATTPMPKSTETHAEYMSRCEAMGNTKDECMKAHEGHKFKDQDESHDRSDHYDADYMRRRYASEDSCCGSCAEHAEAEMIRKDVFDNPGQAAGRAKDIGCEGIHTRKEGEDTLFMPCESREEYMKKTGGDKTASSPCGEGEELVGGECVRVAVTMEMEIDEVTTRVEAATGKTYIRISGVAFHEGVNKNGWGVRPALAKRLAEKEMVGADVTLNHPKAEMGRFKRNMDGGVDEAVVGTVVSASYQEDDEDKKRYKVRYAAEIVREELFASLESGLWLKPGYGVSIGGTGIPSEVMEADEQYPRGQMWFADEFDFDHLAIVHKPAYRNANIEKVERVEANEASLKYRAAGSTHQTEQVSTMTDTETPIETTASELEALRAELVLREARIAEFEAADAARAEEGRLALVTRASELGLKGHEEFATETLTTMIASWEAAHPEPAPVEMTPAAPAAEEPVAASEEAAEPVVASYFNGKMMEVPETLYARCYNSWARAYNNVFAGQENTKALLFEEL